jgi:trehalose 6-phosphate synthase
MGLEERKSRYEHLMAVLTENNLSIWRDRFLSDLAAEDLKRPASIPTPIAAKRPV